MKETSGGSNNQNSKATHFAKGLGWFSIGLGVAELLAPRTLARLIGVRGHENLFRAMGVRELAVGAAVLIAKRPTVSMASRVAGDVLDISLLASGLSSSHSEKGRLAGALAFLGGVAALDVLCTSKLAQAGDLTSTQETTQTIAVNKTVQECYSFWRNLEQLPSFMQHVESVEQFGDGRSRWVVTGPAGTKVHWDAELTEDSENRIAWSSVPGAQIDNAGSVEFSPATAGHGTIVKTTIKYRPLAGRPGVLLARLFGEEPTIQAKEDLRRFKAMIETGEVPTTAGQSSGREFVNNYKTAGTS